jgi:hypothetical protein
MLMRAFPGDAHAKWCPTTNDSLLHRVLFFAGLFVFESTYCFLFVFTLVSLYFVFDSFAAVAGLLAVEFSILLTTKVYRDELPFAGSPHISYFVDNLIGGVFMLVNFLLGSACPLISMSFTPGFLGPFFGSFLLVYRYISSAVIVYIATPHLVEKSWLSTSIVWSIYLTALSLSLFSLGVAVINLPRSFDKTLLWKHIGRKDSFAFYIDSENHPWTREEVLGIQVGYDFVFEGLTALHPSCFHEEDFLTLIMVVAEKHGHKVIDDEKADCVPLEDGSARTTHEGEDLLHTFTHERADKIIRQFNYFRPTSEKKRQLVEAMNRLKARYAERPLASVSSALLKTSTSSEKIAPLSSGTTGTTGDK